MWLSSSVQYLYESKINGSTTYQSTGTQEGRDFIMWTSNKIGCREHVIINTSMELKRQHVLPNSLAVDRMVSEGSSDRYSVPVGSV